MKQDNSFLTIGGIIVGVVGGYLLYRHFKQKIEEQNNEIIDLKNQNHFMKYQFNEYNERIIYLENKATQADYYKSLVHEALKRANEKQALKPNTPYIN